MRKITLADGTEFAIVMCGESRNGVLWIKSAETNLTFRNILDLFEDTKKIKRITEIDAFGVEHVYENYLELTNIQRGQEGNILFALKKAVTA